MSMKNKLAKFVFRSHLSQKTLSNSQTALFANWQQVRNYIFIQIKSTEGPLEFRCMLLAYKAQEELKISWFCTLFWWFSSNICFVIRENILLCSFWFSYKMSSKCTKIEIGQKWNKFCGYNIDRNQNIETLDVFTSLKYCHLQFTCGIIGQFRDELYWLLLFYSSGSSIDNSVSTKN